MRRAAVYSPYLDTLGGGEKYMMTIVQVLLQNNFDVDVLLDKNLATIGGDFFKKKLSERFDLNLSKAKFVEAPIGAGSTFLSRTIFLRKFDLLFCLTDGSVFIPGAKKNILHIQSPIIGEPSKSIWGKIKLKFWNLIIYNSKFTKENSEKNWDISSRVIYPPVNVEKFKPLKKSNYILSVGRFFGYLKDKKHEVLIKTFIDLYKQNKIKDWSLHLVGSESKGDEEYLDQLKNLAKGYPVYFYPNLNYEKLIDLYGKSKIYWHASGYKEDDPTKMEHFGISTVEAMAGGSVPVVIGKGGQVEIVESGNCGFLWESLEELKDLTLKLINDQSMQDKMAKNAIIRAQNFSRSKFEESILKLS